MKGSGLVRVMGMEWVDVDTFRSIATVTKLIGLQQRVIDSGPPLG